MNPKDHPNFVDVLRQFTGHALAGSLAYSTGNSDPDRVAERAVQFGEMTACILIQKYGLKDGQWVRFDSTRPTKATPPSTTKTSTGRSSKPSELSSKR